MTNIFSVIIPAHNEADWIDRCCDALLASELPNGWQAEALVVANGCTDETAHQARRVSDKAQSLGWNWRVLELPAVGKLGALNAGDDAATGSIRIYLDADVVVDPPLLMQIVEILDMDQAGYASGNPRVARAQSWVTRAYARFWTTLPFVTTGTPGFGVFAVNAAGRRRWDGWPEIISDDTYARLNFSPTERHRVEAGYSWPMVEGFANLVRVRRRQNDGVTEVGQLYPHLLTNDASPSVGLGGTMRRLLRDPLGFVVYVSVALAVKTPLFHSRTRWVRGR